MVDWKKIPKIDAHIHLLPQDVIDGLKYANLLPRLCIFDCIAESIASLSLNK